MKNLFLLLLVFFSAQHINAQSFSYSFTGNLSIEDQQLLKTDLEKVPGIIKFSLRYKSEKQMGEIIYTMSPQDTNLSPEQEKTLFSPVMIKQLLITHQVTPLENIELLN